MHARRIVWTMLALSIYVGLFHAETLESTAPAAADGDPPVASTGSCVYVDPWSPDVGVDPAECTSAPALP